MKSATILLLATSLQFSKMLNLNLMYNLHHLLIRMTRKYCKIFKALKEFNNKKNKKHLLKKLKKKKIYRKIKLYNNLKFQLTTA
jgi:hypothetical protein